MLFVVSIFVLMGVVALVIDVAWYWTNSLRVQRAADAAALAGAPYLPNAVTSGVNAALAESSRNGYTNGATVEGGTVQVSANQDAAVPTQMDVTVSAPVPTFFMRVFGINTILATRPAKALIQLPIPMGSPLNYYGIGCLIPVRPNATWPTPACASAGNSNGPSGITDAGGTTQLASQGFWGVAFTRGGDSRNGDAYGPRRVSGGSGWPTNDQIANSPGKFDPATGFYNYLVEVPANGGSVYLFDPEFCSMGPNGSGGQSGTGDQYTAAAPGASNPGPVTTYFNLWDTRGTPYSYSDDTLAAKQVYADPVQSDQLRVGGNYVWGDPGGNLHTPSARDCSDDAAHNRWVLLNTGGPLPAGTYRLQVTTTNMQLPPIGQSGFGGGTQPASSQPSDSVGAANRFGIEVVGPSANGRNPRVYGGGRMAGYTNLPGGTQTFYLAQLDSTNRGKTAVISLYDPGDVGGGAWLRILSPDNNTYAAVPFSMTSVAKWNGSGGDSAASGTTCLETNYPGSAPSFTLPAGCPANFNGSGSHFDDYWLTIEVPIPDTYGSTGLLPPSECQAGRPCQPGWWKIEYSVAGGNDTTTWKVDVRGNPVHLIVP